MKYVELFLELTNKWESNFHLGAVKKKENSLFSGVLVKIHRGPAKEHVAFAANPCGPQRSAMT